MLGNIFNLTAEDINAASNEQLDELVYNLNKIGRSYLKDFALEINSEALLTRLNKPIVYTGLELLNWLRRGNPPVLLTNEMIKYIENDEYLQQNEVTSLPSILEGKVSENEILYMLRKVDREETNAAKYFQTNNELTRLLRDRLQFMIDNKNSYNIMSYWRVL